MKKVGGISLTLGSYEPGLWFDHDEEKYQEKGWGVRFHIVWGKMIRPVPKFWQPGNNPWKGGEPWFVIRIPFMVGPFLSICLLNFGLYIGFKTFGVTERLNTPERYGNWMRPDEFGPIDDEARYLQFSFTIRRTRWK